MEKWVALLRGINVGGRNPLPMRDLTAALEGLGAQGVRTYIQSGNAVFTAAIDDATRFARDLGNAIGEGHGFVPEVLVLPVAVLAAAMRDNPFPEAESDPKSLHLFFLAQEPVTADHGRLEALCAESERFELIGRVFYLHAPDGIGRSKLAAGAEKALGVACTGRNWRTVGAIVRLGG